MAEGYGYCSKRVFGMGFALLGPSGGGHAARSASGGVRKGVFQESFYTLKAISIGQDPYRGLGQAMKLLHLLPRETRMRRRRLSFPAPEGVKAPSSLVNTYIQAGFGVFDSVSWESGETGCLG
ncbi:hypothetical protein NC653_020700 [Populus alba x Populus x berolinensis]|uniref:Uncharacterized protein n=1 Tax=Populus alba x Populus x berolinensis TaxID=444605 RepID=A0AAD6MMY5_9ROSI|nr:hypothetical protein NC653_020700 [Populus alba x Populus x berolinensis]